MRQIHNYQRNGFLYVFLKYDKDKALFAMKLNEIVKGFAVVPIVSGKIESEKEMTFDNYVLAMACFQLNYKIKKNKKNEKINL